MDGAETLRIVYFTAKNIYLYISSVDIFLRSSSTANKTQIIYFLSKSLFSNSLIGNCSRKSLEKLEDISLSEFFTAGWTFLLR